MKNLTLQNEDLALPRKQDIDTVKDALDKVAERTTSLEQVKHEHSNKDVLDGITLDKIALWDTKEVPEDGSIGQVLTKTENGATWQDVQAGEAETFMATYGETSIEDIEAAVDAGKYVYVCVPESTQGENLYAPMAMYREWEYTPAAETGERAAVRKGALFTLSLGEDVAAFICLNGTWSEQAVDLRVPDWAKQPTRPTYTASEVGAMPAVSGGTTGQVLTKTDDGQEWQDQATAPTASDTEAGIAKLYNETGANTDGAITQKAATDAFVDKTNVEDFTILDIGDGATGQVLTKTEEGAAWADAQGGTSEVFIATYGVTTYSDITAAVAAGKNVVLTNDTKTTFASLSSLTSTTAKFTMIEGGMSWEFTCGSAGWAYTQTDLSVADWAKAATKPSYTASEVGALPTAGGTLTGNLTGEYITGTWLQTTDATDLGTGASRFAVLNGEGWVYYRTAAEVKSDLGVSSGIEAASYTATLSSSGWAASGSYQAQTVNVSGLKASYPVSPVIDAQLTGTDADGDAVVLEAWSAVNYVTSESGKITAYCIGDAPTANIPLIINTWG